jgi:ribose 5-phosphate isomerase
MSGSVQMPDCLPQTVGTVDLEAEKALAASRAVDEVRNGMIVGLGTGSTAAYAIREIGRRVSAGLRIQVVATSSASESLARSVGLEPLELGSVAKLDLTIDGADEITRECHAIKGGGGALLREKIVGAASDRLLVIVDSSKPVDVLGRFPLPVEVLPFARPWVERALAEALGVAPVLRIRNGTPFQTEQGNLILDLPLNAIPDPAQVAATLAALPGVVEHGLFLTQIDAVVIARGDTLEVIERRAKKVTRERLPFQPIRADLYTSEELSRGFNHDDPRSIVGMADFQTFQYFVRNGRATPEDPYAGMMQALHDNSILVAMFEFLAPHKKVAAIMGGHREDRGSQAYRGVVKLSKTLTEKGFLMASGGGPGAMEATHLGALLRGQPEDVVQQAIGTLAEQPKLPDGADKIIDDDGDVIDWSTMEKLHAWSAPAHTLMAKHRGGGDSLAVPTWHYGHEPVTPLASHAAKYFLNSIREDVLLYLASQGIIFAPGRAGTLQEVFQDAAQNFYPGPKSPFAPMIFYDIGGFWTEKLPVRSVLEGLFVTLGGEERAEAYRQNVLFTADEDEIIEFLLKKCPSEAAVQARLESLGMMPMMRRLNQP